MQMYHMGPILQAGEMNNKINDKFNLYTLPGLIINRG